MIKIITIFIIGWILSFSSHCANVKGILDGEIQLIRYDQYKDTNIQDGFLYGKIFNLKFYFFKYNNSLRSLVAAPLGVVADTYDLDIFRKNSKIHTIKIPVTNRTIIETQEVIETPVESVLPEYSDIVERVTREDIEIKNILKKVTPRKLWKEEFIEPVLNPKSSLFGIYRIYTQHLRRRTHWGVDYKSPIGTGVSASSDGKVAFVKDLYFPGKTIIIDHGLGLYTGYCHLESSKVKVGQMIEKGQLIGTTGRTGKVSGAHLHWFAVNARVKINPLSLLKIKLSSTSFN